MSIVTKRCRHCKEKKPADSMVRVQLSWYCSYAEAAEYGKEAAKKKLEKEARLRKKNDLERLKTLTNYKNEAQVAVNAYVRERDKGRPCCSCDKPDNGQHQRHASHYRTVKAASCLRFNLKNIHASCKQCNKDESGNIVEYRIRLVKRFGPEYPEWLECQNQITMYTVEYLVRLKKVFLKRTRHLRKLRIKIGEKATLELGRVI